MRSLKIGGEIRPLYFSINSLIELEEITGIDMSEPESRYKLAKIKNIRALAYVGLKHGYKKKHGEDKEPDFTLENVGHWLNKNSISKIEEIFVEESSTGDDDDENEEETKKKSDGVISDESRSAA